MTTAERSLISSAHALATLYKGVATLAAPLALTLGPAQGVIVHERSRGEVEILTDSSTIARRVLRLPGRGSNMGAMMLRQMVLEMHDRYGDGAATAAVMARAMLCEGVKMVAAGANPVLMMHGIEHAIKIAERELTSQAHPIANLDELTALATAVVGDTELGEMLGQMFDTLGEHATVLTEDTPTSHLDHEYIRGGKWDGYIPSHLLIPAGNAGLVLNNPLIVLADEELKTIDQVRPMLELALAHADKPPLLILARNISDMALTTLITNHARGILTVGMLVLSSAAVPIHDDLTDIAALTGGHVLSPVTGRSSQSMQPEFFGKARRVVLSTNGVIIADGTGDSSTIRQRIAEVRAELKLALRSDESNWDSLRMRLARLSGGIGVLKLGAYTEREREIKKEHVKKTLRALEAAHDGGLVPGGGAAYLACLPALCEAHAACQHEDEIYGIVAVEAALKAPFLQIVHNHGKMHPPLALDTVQHLGSGYGFDALHGDYACMSERRILDSLSVTLGALKAASSLAAMIMTTNTIVFTKA
jgi:chaperonin GroEL